MLVSIIVPVYKVEKYLRICVDSILNQTFSDFELILVDDGSPDNCGKICDEYALIDSRVKVIHQANRGLSNARNSAIAVAKGTYLSFVDSDDFLTSRCIEILYTLCLKNAADLSVCRFVRCDENAVREYVAGDDEYSEEVFFEDKMKVFLCTKKIPTTACAKLYKKTLFDDVRYPEGKYYEDTFTTYLLIHKANKIVLCDYVGYMYRCNSLSITNEHFSPRKMDAIEGTLLRAEFIYANYPKLKVAAYQGVLYACNQVLASMGKDRVVDKEKMKTIQILYRKYLWVYLFSVATFRAKFFALIGFVNVKWAWILARCI